MSSFAVSRIAVASAAVALLAACAPDQAPTITGPRGPSFDIGVEAPGLATVCIDPASPAGSYSIAISNVTNVQPGDIIAPSPVVLNPGDCADVITKGDLSDTEIVGVTLTASTGVAGTFSFTCVQDAGSTNCSAASGENSPFVEASGPHGSTTTFLFEADPVVTEGCTLTQGWWKNQGSEAAAAFDFDGGTDNGLTILNTPVKGNPYISLAHQYIAASLNIAAGASIDGAALDAYDDATDYFAVASAADPLPGTYTKSQLSALTAALNLYNTGFSGPLHCDAEVIV
jgi:hypothetical protein